LAGAGEQQGDALVVPAAVLSAVNEHERCHAGLLSAIPASYRDFTGRHYGIDVTDIFAALASSPRRSLTVSREKSPATSDAILATAIALLESGGYEAVQVREVASRAHVSLASIYRRYKTREDLIVAALQLWTASNGHAPVPAAPPGESLGDGLMRIFRHVFEPWEKSPWMLEAYHKATASPAGAPLRRQGFRAIVPAARHLLEDRDPEYAADVESILTHMAYAVIGRFIDGQIPVTAILPTLERAVLRLITDNSESRTRAAEPVGDSGDEGLNRNGLVAHLPRHHES
jgi:TetR/AcrR family transcriptional regulator, cholesterol catabolism regulator